MPPRRKSRRTAGPADDTVTVQFVPDPVEIPPQAAVEASTSAVGSEGLSDAMVSSIVAAVKTAIQSTSAAQNSSSSLNLVADAVQQDLASITNTPVGAVESSVEGWPCSSCQVPYKAKGCYRDNLANRVLKIQVLNERDPESKVYGGRRIDWIDWNNYMPAFACRCAKIVKAKGWKVFGLQFYGECWSGPGSYDLKTFPKSSSCVADDYARCGALDRNCIGEQSTNFVYELASDCGLDFERIGCFKDNKIGPRPLPEYIMTDRERVLKIYSGQSIDWRNWDAYLLEFVCRCAELAKAKGYTTFGVQYYGECWSGPHGEDTYANRGVSGDCQDQCFETCKPYQKFCAGKNFANAVYRLSDAPCEITFEPVGCHGENAINRAFTTELVNEVNPTSSKFDGVMMEYGIKWQGEFKKLLCRCARQANQKGYSMFGVHNHEPSYADEDKVADVASKEERL